MIKNIKLQNFKCFEKQNLRFKALTLLSGLNSSGKSSVLQSLLLLRQSYQQNLLPNTGLALNGDLVCIGTAQDALFEGAKEDIIGFQITWENNIERNWNFIYHKELDVLKINKSETENTTENTIENKIYDANLFGDKFHYLQAERIGPRPYLEMSEFQVKQHGQIGTRGEYTAYFLSMYRDKTIQPLLQHPSKTSSTLIDQVEAWMGEISPGTRINIKDIPDLDLVSLQYSYGLSNSYRATNIGFGISYTLPIIVAILASEPGTLLLLENPEAHLHPKGQAKIGELLTLAASAGIQVVLETHSDHVLNGIRLSVRSGKLDPSDVQLHYFQREDIQGELKTEVVSPQMDCNGRIDNWPEGFFDEWDKSLEALLEPIGEE
jgi:predicted ATPase